ncbi:MAG: iron ABC transporter permease [Anaerolineaceae bacterium]|nr:iron ABC transporter permease [Anaerolineaceae bacterium]
MNKNMKKTARPYFISITLLALIAFVSVMAGSTLIPPKTLAALLTSPLTGQEIPPEWQRFATILYKLRMPRAALIALTGAALGGSGTAYQGLFRNPLADPYLIGISSGAGLGAVLAMSINWPYTPLGLMAIPAAAFVGAILTVIVVYSLARIGKTVPTTNLILAGVAVSAFASAITSFLMLLSRDELHRAIAWLLGGTAVSGWQPVLISLPYTLLGLGTLLTMGHKLNVLQFGDEQAQQLGLPVERIRRWILAAASLTTAAAVSFSGIIGFVGLIVPHLMRILWGNDYRRIMPLSILNGATMLLTADLIARTVMAPREIPTGIITALVGAPFFLWVLRRAKQQYAW